MASVSSGLKPGVQVSAKLGLYFFIYSVNLFEFGKSQHSNLVKKSAVRNFLGKNQPKNLSNFLCQFRLILVIFRSLKYLNSSNSLIKDMRSVFVKESQKFGYSKSNPIYSTSFDW